MMIQTTLSKLIEDYKLKDDEYKKSIWVEVLNKYYPISSRIADVKARGVNYVVNKKSIIKVCYFNNMTFLLDNYESKFTITEEIKSNYRKSLNNNFKTPWPWQNTTKA